MVAVGWSSLGSAELVLVAYIHWYSHADEGEQQKNTHTGIGRLRHYEFGFGFFTP